MLLIRFVTLFALALSIGGPLYAGSFDLEKDFKRLDSAVAVYQSVITEREDEITAYKSHATDVMSVDDIYRYTKHLYLMYLKFDTDSAIHYAQLCDSIATANAMEPEATLARIDLALACILRGETFRAYNLLEKLGDIRQMDAGCQPKMAVTILEFYLRLNYPPAGTRGTAYSREMAELWSRYGGYLPRDGWLYVYYQALITGRTDRDALLRHVAAAPQPSVQAAMLLYALATVSRAGGDEKAYCHYLACSAVNDILSANREASSLIVLLNTPYIANNSRRAARYAMLCTDNAGHYYDRWRSPDIAAAQTLIIRPYEQRLEQEGRRMRIAIGLLVALVVAVCILLGGMRRRRRRTERRMEDMRMANQSLQEEAKRERQMLTQMETSNEQLRAKISQHNAHFMDIYLFASQYIHDVQCFQNSVYNLFVAGRADKAARRLAQSGEKEKHLQAFYQQFDKGFLASHPDFISRLNNLLRPECRVPLPHDALTPELRIYALVSIGMTDSISIAHFLHYSPQTVYNYRLRMRRNALISEKAFARTVADFYIQESGDDLRADNPGAAPITP